MSPPYNPDRPFSEYARLLVGPNRAMTVVLKQIDHLLSAPVRKRLKQVDPAGKVSAAYASLTREVLAS